MINTPHDQLRTVITETVPDPVFTRRRHSGENLVFAAVWTWAATARSGHAQPATNKSTPRRAGPRCSRHPFLDAMATAYGLAKPRFLFDWVTTVWQVARCPPQRDRGAWARSWRVRTQCVAGHEVSVASAGRKTWATSSPDAGQFVAVVVALRSITSGTRAVMTSGLTSVCRLAAPVCAGRVTVCFLSEPHRGHVQRPHRSP